MKHTMIVLEICKLEEIKNGFVPHKKVFLNSLHVSNNLLNMKARLADWMYLCTESTNEELIRVLRLVLSNYYKIKEENS